MSAGKPKGESRGLHFLQQARPAAIQHLMKFFGESGRHLDPRTRFLISVVTKVISDSHRGVQQYVRRALEAGATPDEIIDAVLCAYPCAGLTRVVDAIDVILDMGLPGFEELANAAAASTGGAGASGPAAGAEPQGSGEGGWVEAARLDQLPARGGLRLDLGSRTIALFRIDDRVVAIDDRCRHRGGSLSEGTVDGVTVRCPLHGWSYDLATGRSTDHPQVVLCTYPVRVEDGRVQVKV